MIWKPLPTLETKFEVSDTGQIRHTNTGRVLKASPTGNGYLRIVYYVGGGRENKKIAALSVHRAVATTFLPNPLSLPYVNHKNGNKQDNTVSNLEWCTPSENAQHAVDNGLTPIIGINNPMNKLTESQVLAIRSRYVPRVCSMYKLAAEYNVTPALINNIVKRRLWKHI